VGRLLLLFILVPLCDALLLAKIGVLIGWMTPLALVVVTGVVGAWLFRLEGGRAWEQWQGALAEGRLPEQGVLGGVLLLLGGALLVTPGVITDVVGLLLLLPPSRALAVRALRPWLQARIAVGARTAADTGATSRRPMSATDDARVIGRRVPIAAGRQRAPQVIDADFEVTEHDAPHDH